MRKFLLVLVLAIFCRTSSANSDGSKIDPELNKLKNGGSSVVIVQGQNPQSGNLLIPSVLKIREESSLKTKEEVDRALTDTILGQASSVTKALSAVLKILDGYGLLYHLEWNRYWIIVYDVSDFGVLQKIASLDIVVRIFADQVVSSDPENPPREWPPTGNSTWNQGLIDARCNNITTNGYLGEGVTVGIIDNGVNFEHQELKERFVGGDYAWLIGTEGATPTPTPSATGGRGTGVAGIILGKELGIAPRSRWMACQYCYPSACTTAGMAICAQFMTCPWKYNDATADKVSSDCSKRPKVVIIGGNAIGGGQVFDPFRMFLNDRIQLWNAMEIISVFAMGDSGPFCNSGSVMGNLPFSLGVGAVDFTGTISYSSSRGPSLVAGNLDANSTATGSCPVFLTDPTPCTGPIPKFCDLIKPDLVAPGVDIYTTWIGGDAEYNTVTGTSYAAAHVAGVIAQMISTNPSYSWNYQNIYKLLTKNADRSLCNLEGPNKNSEQYEVAESNFVCNFIMSGICGKEASFPNNLYGWGLVWACRTVSAAAALSATSTPKIDFVNDFNSD